MNKHKIILSLVLIFSFCLNNKISAQQDVQFSQYVFNPLNINTAYAGYRGETYFNAIYRKQWVNFPGSPSTFAASLEWFNPRSEGNVAWSVRILGDKTGPQSTSSAFGGYTYRIKLDEADTKRLCIGIGFGVTQYTLDGNAFIYNDPNDPLIPTSQVSKLIPDANLGIYYYTPKSFIGLSANNILNLKPFKKTYVWNSNVFESLQQSLQMNLTAGTIFKLSDALKLKPTFMMKEDFVTPTSFDFNSFLLIDEKIWIGASYRTAVNLWEKPAVQPGLNRSNSVSVLFDFYLNKNLRLGYVYDIITGQLNPYQNGTHEFSIGIAFPSKVNKKLDCPRYF